MGNSSLNGENDDKCQLLEYLSQDYDVNGIIEINHQFCGWFILLSCNFLQFAMEAMARLVR